MAALTRASLAAGRLRLFATTSAAAAAATTTGAAAAAASAIRSAGSKAAPTHYGGASQYGTPRGGHPPAAASHGGGGGHPHNPSHHPSHHHGHGHGGGHGGGKHREPLALALDGSSLTLEQLEAVARASHTALTLTEGARGAMAASRAVVEGALGSSTPVYGVTTGFGRLADVTISRDRLEELQINLLRSHACGVGPPLARAETRAAMLLRANVLAKGASGIRPVVVDLLLAMLNAGVHPVIPSQGSVGASGDLAPLSHMALVLVGEGSAEYGGEVLPGGVALARAGLTPVRLAAKEGLALNNGTQVLSAVGALALLGAERAVETLEVCGAMSLEALKGTPAAFHPAIHAVRPHAGQITSATRLRCLLADSEIRDSHKHHDKAVQDAYSLRCMPQIHGAARACLAFVRSVLAVEANSATDNPLIFPGAGEGGSHLIVSGGNFHGQPVAQALDLLAIALTDVGAVSERRIERLVNPDLSGDLPAFLTTDPGVSSGFMIAQITAASLIADNRVLSHPASVDSLPTGAGKEDIVSMGMTCARKARDVLANTEIVLAIELLCAAQGLEFRRPLRPGTGVAAAYSAVRRAVPALGKDRVLGTDIDIMTATVRAGAFATTYQGLPDPLAHAL